MKARYLFTFITMMLFVVTSGMAQKKKKNFEPANLQGVWQMCFYVSESPDAPSQLKPGNTFKVLTPGGFITNFTIIPNQGAIITGYGKYEQVSDNLYHESIERSIHLPVLNSQVNQLQFEIKDDKVLHLKFYIEKDQFGNTVDTWYNETWTRVEMPDSYPVDLVR